MLIMTAQWNVFLILNGYRAARQKGLLRKSDRKTRVKFARSIIKKGYKGYIIQKRGFKLQAKHIINNK